MKKKNKANSEVASAAQLLGLHRRVAVRNKIAISFKPAI